VLRGRLFTLSPVRTDEFDAPLRKPRSQRIAVGRHVVDQALRATTQLPTVQQRFNQSDFVRTGTGNGCRDRQPAGVGEDHGLGSLAPFGLADQIAPFFADENVPSAVVSLKSIRPWWSRT